MVAAGQYRRRPRAARRRPSARRRPQREGSSAPSKAASLNGLKRHSTAPRASRRGRTARSSLAVMKTIGISWRRRVSSSCRSGPDMPGIARSRSRQLVSIGTIRGEERLGRRERLGGVPELPQQVRQRFADRDVVVDDRDQRQLARHDDSRARDGVPDRCRRARDREREGGPGPVVVRLGPQAALMALDDRAADEQPDAHAGGLRREERAEQLVDGLRIHARTGVAHAQAHALVLLAFGPDQQDAGDDRRRPPSRRTALRSRFWMTCWSWHAVAGDRSGGRPASSVCRTTRCRCRSADDRAITSRVASLRSSVSSSNAFRLKRSRSVVTTSRRDRHRGSCGERSRAPRRCRGDRRRACAGRCWRW